MRVLRIEYQNIGVFNKGLVIDLTAKDRVFYNSPVSNVHKTIYTNNITCLIGINASGKTTALKLINSAIKVVTHDAGLDQLDISPTILRDGSIMIVDFFVDGTLYRLESTIGEKANGRIFRDEIIYAKSKKEISNRKGLFHYNARHIQYQRRVLEKEQLYLIKDQDSIVAIIKKKKPIPIPNFWMSQILMYILSQEKPKWILSMCLMTVLHLCNTKTVFLMWISKNHISIPVIKAGWIFFRLGQSGEVIYYLT